MTMKSRYYMALDWGEAKIGIALADAETRIAFAHAIVPTEKITAYCTNDLLPSYDIRRIIIGVPTHSAYKENRKVIETFGARIAQSTGVPVVYAEEMFTTKMAQQKLRDIPRRKGGGDDAEAARILLQEWLDGGADNDD